MRRREFLTLSAGAMATLPLPARAQTNGRRRVGVLVGRAAADPEGQKQIAAFQEGLAERGWSAQRNIEIEYRWSAGDAALGRTLAKELIDLKPDLLVVNSTFALVAVAQQTQSIPVVFIAVTDPVAQGIVQSLAKPGGNITGFGAEELSMGAKWFELLKEMAPNLTSFTVLFNPDSAPFARLYLPFIDAARRSCPCELIASPVRDEIEVEGAIAAAGRRPQSGLIALPDSFLNSHRARLAALANDQHVPAIYTATEFTRSGGLLSYGIDRPDLFRRAATYVDRILNGAKPADLPVQQPTKFELAINAKTARALDLTIPPALLARVDEVIE